jgi:hypothetical protein
MTAAAFDSNIARNERKFPTALPVPGSTAAPAVFIGAPPMNLLEPKRRARARVLPETAETLTREI